MEFWGNCKDECKGEMPEPESEYNIAKDNDLFNTAWSEGLYDLRQFEAGYCFTYDPPQQSRSGVSNGLFFMLGHKHLIKEYVNDSQYLSRDSSYLLYSFNIYLHEKVGRFIMKLNIFRVNYFLNLGSILVKARHGNFGSIWTHQHSSKQRSYRDIFCADQR